MKHIGPQLRFIIRPVAVHLPARADTQATVVTTPVDHRVMRRPETRVRSPMSGRRNLANGKSCRLNISDCSETTLDPDSKCCIGVIRMIGDGLIDEDILAIELNRTSAGSCIYLVKVKSECRGHRDDRHARMNRGDHSWRRNLYRNFVHTRRCHASLTGSRFIENNTQAGAFDITTYRISEKHISATISLPYKVL
jgi:hypothetical protein